MRFEVITAVKMSMLVFWAVTTSSALKMEAVSPFETLVSAYKSKSHYYIGYQHERLHRCENLISHVDQLSHKNEPS